MKWDNNGKHYIFIVKEHWPKMLTHSVWQPVNIFISAQHVKIKVFFLYKNTVGRNYFIYERKIIRFPKSKKKKEKAVYYYYCDYMWKGSLVPCTIHFKQKYLYLKNNLNSWHTQTQTPHSSEPLSLFSQFFYFVFFILLWYVVSVLIPNTKTAHKYIYKHIVNGDNDGNVISRNWVTLYYAYTVTHIYVQYIVQYSY